MSLLTDIRLHPTALTRLGAALDAGLLDGIPRQTLGSAVRVCFTGQDAARGLCDYGALVCRAAGVDAVFLPPEAPFLRDALTVAVGLAPADPRTEACCRRLESPLITVTADGSPLGVFGTNLPLMDGASDATPSVAYAAACCLLYALALYLAERLPVATRPGWSAPLTARTPGDFIRRIDRYAYIGEGYALAGGHRTRALDAFFPPRGGRVLCVGDDTDACPARHGVALLRDLCGMDAEYAAPKDVFGQLPTPPRCAVLFDFDATRRDDTDGPDAALRGAGCSTVLVTNRDLPELPNRMVLRVGCRDPYAAPLCASVPLLLLCALRGGESV